MLIFFLLGGDIFETVIHIISWSEMNVIPLLVWWSSYGVINFYLLKLKFVV